MIVLYLLIEVLQCIIDVLYCICIIDVTRIKVCKQFRWLQFKYNFKTIMPKSFYTHILMLLETLRKSLPHRIFKNIMFCSNYKLVY